jgi:hypothetical protein
MPDKIVAIVIDIVAKNHVMGINIHVQEQPYW